VAAPANEIWVSLSLWYGKRMSILVPTAVPQKGPGAESFVRANGVAKHQGEANSPSGSACPFCPVYRPLICCMIICSFYVHLPRYMCALLCCCYC